MRFTKLFLFSLIVLCLSTYPYAQAAGGTAYYVDQTAGNDNNNGTSPSTPWKNAPGMLACTGICASTTLQPGSTVYFNSAGTWSLPSGDYGLHVRGGVTYIGDGWGSGVRATLRATGAMNTAIVDIREDHPTYPTVVKGFDIDANKQVTDGVGINHPSYSGQLIGAVKRLDNLVVHNTWSRTSLGQYKYPIIISDWGGTSATVKNVEVLNSVVHDVSRDGICLYPGDSSADNIIQNITVRGNEVYNTGQDPDYGAGSGVLVKGHVIDAFIENNYIHNTVGAGIFVNGNEGSHYGTGPTNIHFRFNIVNVNTIHGSIRIYDGPSGKDPKDVKIYGNVVYNNNTNGGFLIDPDLGNTNSLLVYNNTFFNAPVRINNTAAVFSPFEFKNNIVYYPGGTPITGSNRFTASSNNLTTDPLFKDAASLPSGFKDASGASMVPTTDGLSLRSGSPAINTGVSLGSAYAGSVNSVTRPVGGGWDIGAYEYAGLAPAPPKNLKVQQ